MTSQFRVSDASSIHRRGRSGSRRESVRPFGIRREEARLPAGCVSSANLPMRPGTCREAPRGVRDRVKGPNPWTRGGDGRGRRVEGKGCLVPVGKDGLRSRTGDPTRRGVWATLRAGGTRTGGGARAGGARAGRVRAGGETWGRDERESEEEHGPGMNARAGDEHGPEMSVLTGDERVDRR